MAPRNRRCIHCGVQIHYSQRWGQWFNTIGPTVPCTGTAHEPGILLTKLT